MRDSHERIPVFGLENVIADRRLTSRIKGIFKSLSTVKGIVIAAASIYAAAYVFATVTATEQTWSEFLQIVTGILVVVVPFYAFGNALVVGAATISSALDAHHVQDWMVAGISPRRIVFELLAMRIFRFIPPIFFYSAFFTYLYELNSRSSYFGNSDITIAQLAGIAIAMAVIQLYLVFASAFIGLLPRATVARFFAVFGYSILHSVAPVLILILVEMTRTFNQTPGGSFSEVTAHVTICSNFLGPLIYAFMLAEEPLSGFSARTGMFCSTAILAVLSYLWYLGTVKLLVRKTMR